MPKTFKPTSQKSSVFAPSTSQLCDCESHVVHEKEMTPCLREW